LLIFPAVVWEGSAVFDHLGKDQVHRSLSQRRVVVEIADELAAEYPQVVNVFSGSSLVTNSMLPYAPFRSRQ
jgi:hypothetical protein